MSKTKISAKEEVQNKIREITGGSTVFVDSHDSDDQFIKLVEYFLPKIDESSYGQEIADLVFVSRSFDSVDGDDLLDAIKGNLGSLEVPNSQKEVKRMKQELKEYIVEYKKRKDR
jgi:hypothetical protein